MKKFEDKNYIVIEEYNKEYFEEAVDEMIKLGFELAGGISTYVRKEDGLIVYCQSLIRKDTK